MTTNTQTAEQRIRALLEDSKYDKTGYILDINTIEVNRGNINELLAELDKARKSDSAKQAKIDALMFEYCPEDMTTEQIDEWAEHQRPVSAQLSAAITAALQQEQK